ncbi:MAG TPA: AMP-binding protein, partial [Candidatus Corynebacterium gallistercoris]|nr:AMP-binding protein [Candidatus Corynebacterium gallistercoris]
MPVKSKYPDIELVDCGLYEYLFASLKEEDEERTAIIDVADGSETNYAQLRNYIESTAGWLHHKGIRKGDVVALHLPNSLAFVIAVHAIWRLGAVVTPVNLLSTPASIANQMADSGATMYLTAAALGEVGAEGAREGGIAEDRIVALDTASGLQQILAERRKAPAVEVRGSDLAALPYSSGTTGLPKGVCLNHHQLVNNIVQAQAFGITRREDVVYGVLPFFHIYGMTALMNLVVAQRAVLVAVPRFDLQSFLEHHQKYSVTFTMIAPPIAVALAKHPMVDNYDLSSMRAIFSGAATMDTELALAVEKRLGIHVQQGFGMTETSPFAHGNLDKDVERGSIGRPAPSTEHMIVDVESGEEIPTPDDGKSEVGELWVRGPQIMEGYLNRPEETAHALPGDGWLRTGDLACHDADGNVF